MQEFVRYILLLGFFATALSREGVVNKYDAKGGFAFLNAINAAPDASGGIYYTAYVSKEVMTASGIKSLKPGDCVEYELKPLGGNSAKSVRMAPGKCIPITTTTVASIAPKPTTGGLPPADKKTPASAKPESREGVVNKYDAKGGFAFLNAINAAPDARGATYYTAYISKDVMAASGIKSLKIGDCVEYELKPFPGGNEAKSVRMAPGKCIPITTTTVASIAPKPTTGDPPPADDITGATAEPGIKDATEASSDSSPAPPDKLSLAEKLKLVKEGIKERDAKS